MLIKIFVGLNSRKFEALAWQSSKFCLSMMIKNSEDKLVWRFISVYGSLYDEGKPEFIKELHSLLENWDGPTLIGGDFNLVASVKEKSNDIVNHKWMDLFQEWIHNFGLLELKNSSRSYTWTNNQDQPIMAAINKLFLTLYLSKNFLEPL